MASTSVPAKKLSKEEREHQVLMGLVEYYIKTGKPVGSKTLQEVGFEELSSATIRNYFSHLEKQGYLQQPHTSGGRVPTEAGLLLYAKEVSESDELADHQKEELKKIRGNESKEIASFLQEAAEQLSRMSGCAVFLSAPRFDQDFLTDIKLMPLNDNRCLCALISDFGTVKVEILHLGQHLSTFSVKRIEEYFGWRLTNLDKPQTITAEEEDLAQRLYNELILRYVIGYSTFTDADVHRTGFSKLLAYPDFQENTTALANSLSLFENAHSIRLLLRECSSSDAPKCWVGSQLTAYSLAKPDCSVIAIPYYINMQPVGAIGIMGPLRIPYKELFALLRAFSEAISTALTRNIYKFKITFRQPSTTTSYSPNEELLLIGATERKMLEDKRRTHDG